MKSICLLILLSFTNAFAADLECTYQCRYTIDNCYDGCWDEQIHLSLTAQEVEQATEVSKILNLCESKKVPMNQYQTQRKDFALIVKCK